MTKLEIMQCAVAKSPKVCISAHGIQIPSLLDSGSEVTLLRQSYFEKHLLPKIQVATSEKAKAHQLFHLMVVNDGQLPVKMYTELVINFLGLKVPNVGILVVEDPSQDAGQETPVKATWYCRMESSPAILQCIC